MTASANKQLKRNDWVYEKRDQLEGNERLVDERIEIGLSGKSW